MMKFTDQPLLKTIIVILVVTNFATAWLFYKAKQQSVDVAVGKALLPFYLTENGHFRAQSVDVHKLLDAAGVSYKRRGPTLTAGYLQIEFGSKGDAVKSEITR